MEIFISLIAIIALSLVLMCILHAKNKNLEYSLKDALQNVNRLEKVREDTSGQKRLLEAVEKTNAFVLALKERNTQLENALKDALARIEEFEKKPEEIFTLDKVQEYLFNALNTTNENFFVQGQAGTGKSKFKKLDIIFDLRNPLPFPNNSVDFIYNEHFFEHLTVEEGQKSLKDFLRVLRPGGVMRIAMPDLERVVENYNNQNWKEDNKETFKKFGLDFIQTRAEYINIAFRWWGHQWLYDWEELERRLREAGFTNNKMSYLSE